MSTAAPQKTREKLTQWLGGGGRDDPKRYTAHCHCNAVRYTFKLPDLTTYNAVKCNCSICRMHGYVLGYPAWSDVNFEKGWDHMDEYRFGSKTRPNLFCKTCGCAMLIDLRKKYKENQVPRIAINLRMVDGIDVDTLNVENLDGWSEIGPFYEHAPKDGEKVEGVKDKLAELKVDEQA